MPAQKPVAEAAGGTSSIPRHLWAPPITDARRSETTLRLPRLVLLLPALTLVAGNASAAAGVRAHTRAAALRLGLAMTALIGLAAAAVRHCRHVARHRREAPR